MLSCLRASCSGSPRFSLGQATGTGACQAFFMVLAVLSTLSFTFSAASYREAVELAGTDAERRYLTRRMEEVSR